MKLWKWGDIRSRIGLARISAEADGLIDAIITKLELEALVDRTIERLSGGERQRVALAKVMAQQPSLLMLDEPTTFLRYRLSNTDDGLYS